jgi:hypothetical protein
VLGGVLDSCIDWGHWGLGRRALIGALGARVWADLWASTGEDNFVLSSAGRTVIRYVALSLGRSRVLALLDGMSSCIDWGHGGLGPRALIGALGARVGADLWASTGVDYIVLLSVGRTG